jgi:hypothetical protein
MVITIMMIISGSTVHVTNFAASHLRFRNLIKKLGSTPLDEWSARRKGLYLHRTTQHRKIKTNIHASNRIQTHDPSTQATKTYALDWETTGIDKAYIIIIIMANKPRRLWCKGHVARMENMINDYTILVGKPERKRLLGRLRHKWMILQYVLFIFSLFYDAFSVTQTI